MVCGNQTPVLGRVCSCFLVASPNQCLSGFLGSLKSIQGCRRVGDWVCTVMAHLQKERTSLPSRLGLKSRGSLGSAGLNRTVVSAGKKRASVLGGTPSLCLPALARGMPVSASSHLVPGIHGSEVPPMLPKPVSKHMNPIMLSASNEGPPTGGGAVFQHATPASGKVRACSNK
jgi:hypothetical protein